MKTAALIMISFFLAANFYAHAESECINQNAKFHQLDVPVEPPLDKGAIANEPLVFELSENTKSWSCGGDGLCCSFEGSNECLVDACCHGSFGSCCVR